MGSLTFVSLSVNILWSGKRTYRSNRTVAGNLQDTTTDFFLGEEINLGNVEHKQKEHIEVRIIIDEQSNIVRNELFTLSKLCL